MQKSEELQEMWSFPWPVMEVLLKGKSSIDMQRVNVNGRDDARAFVKGYGYNPDDPVDQRIVNSVMVEAINFIVTVLLTEREVKRGLVPPKEVMECDDACKLLMWASNSDGKDPWKGAWACAVLRVIHTIAHIEGVIRHTSIDIAREQIMKRFQSNIFRGEDGILYLGDKNQRVRLERVEWKHHKTRESIILKLLHKKDNVAENIYDQLGVRIVTSRLCDVMQVVKYLRTYHLVTFANCVPSRSRSNLIDLTEFKNHIDRLQEQLKSKEISAKEFATKISDFRPGEKRGERDKSNPHSSKTYRSIQLTCRQLIRARNPELGWLDKIKGEIDTESLSSNTQRVLEELRYYVEHWHSVREVREVKSFFPFEVQILDATSYANVLTGEATHDRYKQSQLRAARKRVLGAVFSQVRQDRAQKT
jgi:uncharacterized protein (TIGR04562 family)